MSFSSKPLLILFGLIGLLALLGTAGCMAEGPNETDIPWSAPASWEGTMPLPSGFANRYE